MIAWALGTECDDYLDVEDLFVIPLSRRKGNGALLMTELTGLAAKLGLALRFWVPHVDMDGVNEIALRSLLERKGFQIKTSPHKWAAGLAE